MALKASRDLDRIKIEAQQKIAAAQAEAESLRLQRQNITRIWWSCGGSRRCSRRSRSGTACSPGDRRVMPFIDAKSYTGK